MSLNASIASTNSHAAVAASFALKCTSSGNEKKIRLFVFQKSLEDFVCPMYTWLEYKKKHGIA
jgi:hypothetical protein